VNSLLYVYTVPLHNEVIPAVAQNSYLTYKSVSFHSFRSDFSRSYAPLVPSVDGLGSTSTWTRCPKLSVTNTTAAHYGLSFLFVNEDSVLVTHMYKLFLTIDVSFFTFTGNNGVGVAS
jgi:hypothetical protein